VITARNVVLDATVRRATFDGAGLPFGSGPGYLAITAGWRASRTSVARRIAVSYLPAWRASFASFSVLGISPTSRPLSRERLQASMARVNRSIASALVSAGLAPGSGEVSVW